MTTSKTAGRRRFGSVRRLPSGRFQARYRDETGAEYAAPETFASKTAAARWLATVETDMLRGHWIEPRSGQVTLRSYADEWLASRPNLRPRTRELYASLLRLHILPGLGAAELGRITPSAVRRWHADLCNSGRGPPTVAKSYRLLRTILGTAVTDEVIFRNPCTVKGPAWSTAPRGRWRRSPRSTSWRRPSNPGTPRPRAHRRPDRLPVGRACGTDPACTWTCCTGP